jgi:hypothetical protein
MKAGHFWKAENKHMKLKKIKKNVSHEILQERIY